MKIHVKIQNRTYEVRIGDIHARHGEIQAISPKGAVSEIRANVPLKAMFGYSTDLRSATQGRAIFTMQFFAYDKV